MRAVLRWWWRGDPEGLERAKQADQVAGERLDTARENGRKASQLLIRNHLSERFIREIRENHA